MIDFTPMAERLWGFLFGEAEIKGLRSVDMISVEPVGFDR